MKTNLFGISNIKSHTIKTHLKNIDLEINHFARTHNTDIIDIQTHLAPDGDVVAIILYQREE